MQGTLKLPLGFTSHTGRPGASGLFRAWIRAPLDLKPGDEIEVDLPLASVFDVSAADARKIRASGRIVSLAVHADGRLWYEFAADSSCALDEASQQQGNEFEISGT